MTVEILKQIRDEIRATRADLSERLDQTNARLDETNGRLDQNTGRLGAIEGAVLDLAEQQRFVVRWLRAGGQRDRQLERELDLLKLRVGALEGRTER